MIRTLALLCLTLTCVTAASAAESRLTAFPGAEGYGRFARGGRGGDVYAVTSLEDDGPGSLREGLRTIRRGTPRTIVFRVSGTIHLRKELRIEGVSGLTIAGQTSPGGIAIADRCVKLLRCSDVVVRHLRLRLGDRLATSDDVISIGDDKNTCHDIILDHVSATWGVDGIMDVYSARDFTLQWCLFGEALNDSTHYKKEPHAMLMSFRTTKGNVSLHHNLLFSSRDRHPTLGGGDPKQSSAAAIFDFRQNIIYNWEGACNLATGVFNLENNFWQPGPNTRAYDKSFPVAPKAEAQDVTRGRLTGNVFEGQAAWSEDNYAAFQWGTRGGKYVGEVTREKFILKDDPVVPSDRPTIRNAQDALKAVLEGAGANLPRDQADKRIVEGVEARTNRRIDSQKEVGGWPELSGGPAPADQDGDGMPDDWERANGLDPADPADRNRPHASGWTMLETYLAFLALASR